MLRRPEMTNAGENGRAGKGAADAEVSSSEDVSFWFEAYLLLWRYKLLLLTVSFFFTFVVGLVALPPADGPRTHAGCTSNRFESR